MGEQSIRALVAALHAADRIARVARKVDPAEHMAAIAMKVWAQRGRAVLFEDANGWRVASALLAERWQWAMALDMPADNLLAFVERNLDRAVAPVDVAVADAPVAARRREGGALGLELLPLPRAGAGDDAAQMVAVALARDPDSGRDCIALTRHHVLGPGRLSLIGMSPALAQLCARYHARGQAMPLVLAVGADPALYLAAGLGTWRAADCALAGALAGAPIKLLRGDADAPPVPAEAELALIGEVAPGDTAAAGRLATPFGLAADAGLVPVFTAMTVLQRADPVFYAMQVGAPGDLAGTLALGAEALVARHIRNIEGGIDVLDVRCPPAAGGQVVVVKLRGRVEGQAKTALMGALSGVANGFKLAIAVDEDVNAADLRDVFWSVASRTHAEKDVAMIDGLRAHAGDIASPADASGVRVATRWLIDSTMPALTQPQRREEFARASPKNLDATDLAAFLPPR
jgi:UbiD family decarboxylase